MLPHDIPGLIGSWRFDSLHYAGGEFKDISGYRNPFVLRQGAAAFEVRSGGEGLILNNTNLFTALCPIAYAGTIMVVFQDGILNNGSRFLATFEDFDQTTERTGNPNYFLSRFEGSGNHRLNSGHVSDTLIGLLGEGTGGVSHVATFAADQIRAQCSIRIGAGADVDNATSTITATSPKGPDMVLGRLNSAQTDVARTAVAGIERFWLREMHCWGRNLLKDENSLVTALMAELG